MSYVSPLYPGEFIVDDDNADLLAPVDPIKTGLELPPPVQRAAFRSSEGHNAPFSIPTMSREEIRDRIKEREQHGATLSKIVKDKGIPTSNQDSLNYCWTYGVFTNINCQRAYRNMPYIEWSRESVAAPIKGGSNSGGWGDEALQYMVKYGMMPQDLWPQYSRSLSYNTPANLLIAAQNKVTEFLILQDRDFLQMMTALVLDHSVAVGYNWWRHEVCAVDPVIIGESDLGIRIWNSWGNSYGSNGMAILAESKATADDAVIAVVQMAA